MAYRLGEEFAVGVVEHNGRTWYVPRKDSSMNQWGKAYDMTRDSRGLLRFGDDPSKFPALNRESISEWAREEVDELFDRWSCGIGEEDDTVPITDSEIDMEETKSEKEWRNKRLKEMAESAEANRHVDYGFWRKMTDEEEEEVCEQITNSNGDGNTVLILGRTLEESGEQ